MRAARFNSILPLLGTLVACAGTTNAPRSASVAAATAVTDLRAPKGFVVEQIARIDGARELAPLPNGDLLVGTNGSDVYIVADAEAKPARPEVFATFDDAHAAGIAYSAQRSEIYVATMHHVCEWPRLWSRGSRQHNGILMKMHGSVDGAHSRGVNCRYWTFPPKVRL